MREFSDLEKQILSTMVCLQKANRLSRQNIILRYFPKLYIKKEKNGDHDNLFIYSNDISKKNFTHITFQIYFLYDYLKSEHFIKDLGFGFPIDPIWKESGSDVKKYIIYDYEDFFISKDNLGNELILSETIVKLVENNFLTNEQIRFKKQMNDAQQKHEESMFEAKKQTKYSQGAFYMAIAAFIVSLCSPIFSKYFNNDELIRKEIRSVRTQTPKLINQQIKNDTLRVNIIKKSHNHE